MDNRPTSPTPQKVTQGIVLLTFFDALREVMGGKRIARQEWESKEEYGVLQDTVLTIYRFGKFHQWLVNEGDLIATDWYVVPEGN